VVAWAGISWLRLGTGVGSCECGKENSGFQKMRGISRLVEDLLASLERLLSVELESIDFNSRSLQYTMTLLTPQTSLFFFPTHDHQENNIDLIEQTTKF